MLLLVANFHSFYGWVIFHYIYIYIYKYVSHLLFFICWWTLMLLLQSWLLLIMLLWMLEWIYLFGYMCVFVFNDFAFRFLFCLDKYPGMDLMHWMVVLFLCFWGTSILFSTLVVPIYIPTNSVYGFHFLHILASICYLSFWL